MSAARRLGRTVLYILLFLLVVAGDQLFKAWIVKHIPLNASQGSGNLPLIPGIVHLTHIHNQGAAFGMLQGGRWLFLLLLAAFAVLVLWALRTNQLSDPFSRVLAVLGLGGAVANGIDRALYGYVVDMFELEFMRFAVFNVADAVMNVCVVLFILWMLFHREAKDGP